MMRQLQAYVCDPDFCPGSEYTLVVPFEANPPPTEVSRVEILMMMLIFIMVIFFGIRDGLLIENNSDHYDDLMYD